MSSRCGRRIATAIAIGWATMNTWSPSARMPSGHQGMAHSTASISHSIWRRSRSSPQR
ncbi:hypothetical protein RB200_40010 [Streptomyces sp. PmtG]